MNNISQSSDLKTSSDVTNTSDKKSVNKKSFIMILKFLCFSIGAGVIQLIVFTIFNEAWHLNYWISYVIALTCSVTFNFTLNRKFTFRAANNVPLAMFLAFLLYVPFTPYSAWLEDHLTRLGWNEYLVLFLNMVQNLILEFLWYKFVVFRKNNKEKIQNVNSNDDDEIK